MKETIEKQGSRILTPTEYAAIRTALKPKYQLVTDGLLATGMRVTEYWRFVLRPDWYKPSRHCIDLPRGSILKVRARQHERTTLLSTWGTNVVEQTIANPPTSMARQGLQQMLVRAAIRADVPPQHINPKMFRKTWISWLIASGANPLLVAVSSGHNPHILTEHYLAIGFPKDELEKMKYYVAGWGV